MSSAIQEEVRRIIINKDDHAIRGCICQSLQAQRLIWKTRKLQTNKRCKKQSFLIIYTNAPEDYELYETDEEQIKAVMVDVGSSKNIY